MNAEPLTPVQQKAVRVLQALDQWYAGLPASERLHLKSLPRVEQIAYVKQHAPVLALFHQ